MQTSTKRTQDLELDVVANDGREEDSGVFVSRSRLAVDVAIGALYTRTQGDPAPIYATPFVRSGRERTRYTRDYCLGVRFPTGVIASEDWEMEMRRDGVPAFVIDRCHEYLADAAL